MTDQTIKDLTDDAAQRAVDQSAGSRRPRVLAVVAAAVLVVALIGGGAMVWLRLDNLTAELDTARTAAELLGDQLGDLGVKPVVDPPGPGQQGIPGSPGRDGRDGTDGEDGQAGPRGPRGGPGKPGAPGAPGGPGGPGAPGEQGAPGESGPRGQDGAPGQDGKDGQDGQDGAPPAGWTWTDEDGREQSCSRSGGPDTAPMYTCTAAPPAPPEPLVSIR